MSEDAPTPCVRYGELYTKFDEKIDKIYSHTNILPDQLKFSTGREVLVPRVGEEPLDFASCSWLSLPDVAIGEMISVYNTEQNPLFVAFYFNAMLKHEFAEKVEGGNVSNLYYDRLIDIPVKFPSTKEQKLVAWFFDTLNNTITFHKRKLNGLKELKKGYLQQMFPQVGERVPQMRFAGFTGDWEVRKLGEVVELNPPTSLPDSFEYVDLESVIGISLIYHRAESKDTAPSRAQRLAQRGDVFFQTVRPYQKNNYLFDLPFDNFVFSTGYAQLRPKIDSYFLLCKIQEKNFVDKVLDRCTGTSYPAINSTDLSEIEIEISSDKNEQVAIGNFFRSLDTQIATQQTKLEKLKQLKAAYLQKMFV